MQESTINVAEQHYILISAARTARRTAILKHGDTFAVFDSFGDIAAIGLDEPGLYHEGTRFLSTLMLRIGTRVPLLLSSRTATSNILFGADLTNPDIVHGDEIVLPRDLVHVFRARFLADGRCHERIRMVNYSGRRIALPLTFAYAADFADIFEVRGTRRSRRGISLTPQIGDETVELSYKGLDGVTRRTRLAWSATPDALSAAAARFDVTLEAHDSRAIELTVDCSGGADHPPAFDDALAVVVAERKAMSDVRCSIVSSSEQFNEWLLRSERDLDMLTADTPYGPYPHAGVPWFSTVFGRDGIITALETLWIAPAIARGVLKYLAATQAQASSTEQDSDPGKILHEMRSGEMAALGEVPFGRYYGSVDATPLFVLLAGEYYRRTADLALAASIWPNVERALAWMAQYGDRDGDGFLEYARRSPNGLIHQGWKDSQDSVFHADGTLADAPIALCEVQGYSYAAQRSAAVLARALGEAEKATDLERRAESLRQRFEEAFWCEELGTYALALDGRKRPCAVASSNPGHCLYTGIVDPERARRTADTLMAEQMFSGWGIRTIAAGVSRYNPMSYHNGSVWPHDNALAAAGFAKYELSDRTVRVLAAMFDVSHFVDLRRMPELFCGFRRRPEEGPTLYPVACAPQAWAAGAVFLMLQSCLGVSIDSVAKRVSIAHPQLPRFLNEITVRGLVLRPGVSVDLFFTRVGDEVAVTVLDRTGDAVVSIIR
jgi:glycogen debranching enzyme